MRKHVAPLLSNNFKLWIMNSNDINFLIFAVFCIAISVIARNRKISNYVKQGTLMKKNK